MCLLVNKLFLDRADCGSSQDGHCRQAIIFFWSICLLSPWYANMQLLGLHGLLKSIQKPCNLKKFKGQTIGVDAYGWLHRGTVACAIDLALGKHTTKLVSPKFSSLCQQADKNCRYVDFAMNRVRMLLYFGVTPYLVFDGDNLPSKAGTEASRAARREESRKLGLELYRSGRASQAHQELQKAVDVTPHMARLLIEELKKLNVQYVVAPYEADAQLVYLEKQGIINGIISEDSDLLVFGAKRLLSKLDQHGDCIEICRSDFAACRDISLIGWTDASFRQMCILSGCDYLPSIPNMGLKTAYRSIRKHKTIERVVKMVQFEGKSKVPPEYMENFKRAELTFLHQRVFCPSAKKLVTLNPIAGGTNVEELAFIGGDLDPEIAISIACGDLDPSTKDPIELKPSYSERSRLVLQRRQTLPSTEPKKPNKPISAFFTPKRVPLGELDPNSLTPSPSQQRLLERHSNNSWQASSVPARVNTTRSVSSPLTQRERIQDGNRESFLARAAAVSGYQPPKRQRLCSDVDENTSALNGERRTSRFFAASNKGGDVIGNPNMSVKKARKSNLGVYSDDTEKTLSQFDLNGRPGCPTAQNSQQNKGEKSNPNLSHLEGTENEDESAACAQSLTSGAVTATAHSSLDSSSSSESTSQTTVATSIGPDSEPEMFERAVEYHVQQHNLKLHQKYGYRMPVLDKEENARYSPGTNGTNKVKSQFYGETTALEANSNAPGSLGTVHTDTSKRTSQMTPLERLKHAALSRPRSTGSLGRDTTSKRSSRSSFTKSRSSLSNTVGSEDLIIPNSEDEEDDFKLLAEKGSPVLDLKKFRFEPPQ